MTNQPSDEPRDLDANEQHVAGLLAEHFSAVDEDPCFSCDLEGYVAGRLDAGARAAVEAHLAECATCREALPIVRQLHDEGALEMPSFARGPAVDAPPGASGRVVPLDARRPPEARSRRRWGMVMAAAAVLVAAAVSVPLLTSDEGHLIAKGAVGVTGERVSSDRVDLGVLRAGVTFRASSGDELQHGDLVRFFYTAETEGYLAVFHVAVDREVSVMYPTEAGASARVPAGDDVALDAGATIEGGDRCEWVVGVFSDTAIQLAPAANAISRLAVLDPAQCGAVVRVPGARSVSVLAVRQ